MHHSGVVLVTGASTGIGRDAAVALAKKEPKLLVFAGVRSSSSAKAIEALKLPNLKPVSLDVASDRSVDGAYKAITKEAAKRGLPFVGLVNNAGIAAVSWVWIESTWIRFDSRAARAPYSTVTPSFTERARGVPQPQGRAGHLRRERLRPPEGHAEIPSPPSQE